MARTTLRLTPAEAERLRLHAQLEYERIPHASPPVGRERYRASIEAINALCYEETLK